MALVETIGAWLREMPAEQREQIAQRVGCTEKTLRNFANKKHMIRFDTGLKICAIQIETNGGAE